MQRDTQAIHSLGKPLMLVLRKKGIEIRPGMSAPPRVFRLTSDPNRPTALRKSEGYIHRRGGTPSGFAWIVKIQGPEQEVEANVVDQNCSSITLPDSFSHLSDGDILRVGIDEADVAVLFQKSARHHTFLLTERCNHYCLMCSQPPRDVQDDWIVADIRQAIRLIDRSTPEILFTGGEPTLLGSRIVDLVAFSNAYLPETGIHILTNGRAFKDASYAQAFADTRHPDLMFGIPIYSDQSVRHDYVVQADGAFDETIRGILNLKRHGLRVEVRVVVHRQTYERLPQLARFLARNFGQRTT